LSTASALKRPGVRAVITAQDVGNALGQVPALPEWIDAGFLAQNAWPRFGEAIARLHAPETEAELLPSAPPRARLAYDELLANQLALAVIDEARRLGYARMRLDTLPAMTEAIPLYRGPGFEPIQAYRFRPVPGPLYPGPEARTGRGSGWTRSRGGSWRTRCRRGRRMTG